MAEDESARASPFAGSSGAFLAATLGTVSDNPRIDTLLERQIALADLQIDTLNKVDAFELSHLRFRRFSDWAKFALELSAGLIALLIVCALGTMVWSASRSRDLVVEPFSVPADVVQSGMTGSVLAARVLDRLGAMQASTNSLAEGAGSYRSDDRDKVRVEIPDTGISIGELNRYLRQWLGDDIAVSGDLVHTAKGLALTIRYGDRPGSTVSGAELDKLVEQAAERLYRAARPLRYVDYLAERARYAEGEAILAQLTAQGGTRERALAYITLASLRYAEGNIPGELDAATTAAKLDPSNAAAWYTVDAAAFNIGHRQLALDAEETVLSLIAKGRASDLNPDMATTMPAVLSADRDDDKGDPEGATAHCQVALGVQDCGNGYMAGFAADAHDLSEMRRYIATLPALGPDGKPNGSVPAFQAALARLGGDWPRAVTLDRANDALLANRANESWIRQGQFWPRMAIDLAHSGDFAAAQALIAKTALDCDDCVIARGQVATLKHDWAAAQHWFALVSARMPSMPQADTPWGAMLLARGDVTGAIARLASAHIKGPNSADPLELWGEALIAANRSDLALAKFEEAARHAPNWGRLHLKWGEALLWLGRRNDAQKQFALAAALFLTPSEQSERLRDLGGRHAGQS